MSTRERIITIRLLEKASRQPAFAALLGIEESSKAKKAGKKEEPP